jgi:hypothetical protein
LVGWAAMALALAMMMMMVVVTTVALPENATHDPR